jgi:hypothetical protein
MFLILRTCRFVAYSCCTGLSSQNHLFRFMSGNLSYMHNVYSLNITYNSRGGPNLENFHHPAQILSIQCRNPVQKKKSEKYVGPPVRGVLKFSKCPDKVYFQNFCRIFSYIFICREHVCATLERSKPRECTLKGVHTLY